MMRSPLLGIAALLSSCLPWIAACDRGQPAPAASPALAPAAPAAVSPQAPAAPAAPAPSPDNAARLAAPSDHTAPGEKPRDKTRAAPSAGGAYERPRSDRKAPAPAAPKVSEHARPSSAKPEPAKAELAAAEPVAPEPVKLAPVAPPPATKVVVPRTDHVHAEFPKGLQAWLDADSRMQPWVAEVMRVADRCYARERESNASAAGVIEVAVTMHQDARPDADILALPPELSGIVVCATGDLMRSGMPLFTGKEGDRYTVRIAFER